ncbi:GDSL esterase/lipase At1g28580-like [Carex rostrata]
MDSFKLSPVVLIFLFLILLISTDAVKSLCCFDRIFIFGDSMTDTGNGCPMQGGSCQPPPYGETYFHKPNGRWCDGRLIVDFIAEAYGLQLPPPSMAGNTPEYFQHGASFAVAGSMALNNSAYKSVTGLNRPGEDHSLGIQLQSLKDLLPIIAQGSNTSAVMTSSLFVVGEIGGVDYIGGLVNNISVEEMRSWVPSVVAAISSAVNDLISQGATTLIVPGNYAVGCAPWFLAQFQSNNTEDYDIFKCIKRVNELSVYHNTLLMEELTKQRLLHPLTKIVYADYYGAQSQLFLNAKALGFTDPLYACCGAPGEPYNWSVNIQCGSQRSQSCPDPAKYISWDGNHLTEAANHKIANEILYGPYAFPPL